MTTMVTVRLVLIEFGAENHFLFGFEFFLENVVGPLKILNKIVLSLHLDNRLVQFVLQ